MEGLSLLVLALCAVSAAALPSQTADGEQTVQPVVEADYHHRQHRERAVEIPIQDSNNHVDIVNLISASHKTLADPIQFTPEKPCPKGCLEHGTCDYKTGVCTCNMGYHGPDCQTAYQCTDQCNFHGACIADFKCQCAPQFGGDACEIDMRCPDDCNGQGTCINGGMECKCNEGWTGETCDQKVLPMLEPRVWERLFPSKSQTDGREGTGSKPEARRSHVGVLYGNSKQVMVWGGRSQSDQPLDDMWIFDLPSAQWTRKSQKGTRPGPRYDAAAVSLPPYVFVFGGFEPCDEDRAFSNDLWQWSIQEERWSRVPMILESDLNYGPAGRAGHVFVAVETSLYLFGGHGSNGVPLSDLWRFSTLSRKWQKLTSSSFGSRHLASVASFDSSAFYVFGGVDADGVVHNTLHKYDIGLDSWHSVQTNGTAPAARHKHSSIVRDGTFVVAAGSSGAGFINDMYVLDTATMVWSELQLTGDGISAIASFSLVGIGSKAVLIGGETASGMNEEVFVFDLDSHEGTRLNTFGDLPEPRLLFSANVIEDKLWMYGGQTSGSKKLDDLWDFDLKTQVWTAHTPTAVSAADSAAVYRCGAINIEDGSASGGVVTEEAQVEWPSARSGHVTTVISGSETLCSDYATLVLFGGVGSNEKNAFNDIWYFCGGSQQWTEVPFPAQELARPEGRSSAAIAFVNGKLLIFGGMTAEKARLNDFWMCQLGTGQCSEVPVQGAHKPHTRRSMSLHIDPLTKQPFVFGGYWKEKNTCSLCSGAIRSFEKEHTTDVWKYQAAYSRWKRLTAQDAPDQRYCAGSSVVGNKMFMFGGYAIDGIVEHNDLWYVNLDASVWRRMPATDGLPVPVGRHDFTFDIWNQTERVYAVVFGGIGVSGMLHDMWITDITDATNVLNDLPRVSATKSGAPTKHVVA